MSSLSEGSLPLHLLDFVDRIDELGLFRALVEKSLEARRERILIFHGPKEIGKTVLLDRIEHECSILSVSKARISFEGGTFNNYLRIMRTIRDQLGASAFTDWTELVNYYYARPSSDLKIHIESTPSQSQVNIQSAEAVINGDLVGGNKIEIRDNFIVVPRADTDPTMIQDSLTDKFLEALERFTHNKPAVLLFDSVDVDDFDYLTRQWFWHSLVERVIKFSGYSLIPVIALIRRPDLERAVEAYTKQSELRPLTKEYVEEYLRLHDAPAELVAGAAMMILAQTDRSPGRVAEAAQKFFQLLTQGGFSR